MKHVSWILTIPLTALLVVFAVANREFVAIDLWPFEFALPLPIFVLVLGSLVIGFFIGAGVAWLGVHVSGLRWEQLDSEWLWTAFGPALLGEANGVDEGI